jgi:hypothetical protein
MAPSEQLAEHLHRSPSQDFTTRQVCQFGSVDRKIGIGQY